jgi:HlyD family secretion protein
MNTHLKRLVSGGWRYALPVIALAVVGGYFFFGRAGDVGTTLTIVHADFREQVTVSGTVIAAKSVDLGFAANGRISYVRGAVGQHVSAGTVLAQTENGDLSAALAQKLAALAGAKANLALIVSGTRPEEIAIASAGVESGRASLVDAVLNAYTTSDDAIHNKADALFTNPRSNPQLAFGTSNASLKAGIEAERASIEPVLANWALLVSKLTSANAAASAKQSQSYLTQVTTLLADMNAAVNQGIPDATITSTTLSSYGTTLATARANVNTAASALTSDVAALDSAERTLVLKEAGSTSGAIETQQAAVAAAEADVTNARAAFAKTQVVAPFAGTITRMDAKVGEIVSPSTSLISMQSDAIFQIETFIPEVAIARVAPGNAATTTLDAYGSAVEFPSKVVAVDPAETVKDGVPTYKTTLAFLGPDARIRSGMTANVRITTGTLHDAIVIPAGAVDTRGGASYVSVVDADGKVGSRSVTLGSSPALGQVHVLAGLSAGEVIVLSPAQ